MDDDDENVEALQLRSAQLTVKLRRKYESIKTDLEARYYTYVLMLAGKAGAPVFYVGSSDNVIVRLMEHYLQSPHSACFVRENGPILRIVEIVKNSKKDDERYKTLEWQELVGWQSVRGAGWCRTDMPTASAASQAFQRCRTDFEYLTREEIDAVGKHAKNLAVALVS